LTEEQLQWLPGALLPWYEKNRRDLPWRRDQEPYHIWLSEIMLQQTRVEAVKGYYIRFLEALPDIAALATCDDEVLHKLWEGLGYYSRVRNLKKAAKVIMEQHSGVFPRDYDAIRALPGIGDYTAGAICSIAFDMPMPAVDGNVLRVMARLRADDTPIDLVEVKARVRQELAKIYPVRAGDFTQALMELGATICGPNRAPDCEKCPCWDQCLAHLQGNAGELPVKLGKKPRRIEDMTVFLLCCDGRYALRKRADTGLLAGLWEFPHVPGHLETGAALHALEGMGVRPRELQRRLEKKHVFTHVQWNMRGYYLEVSEESEGFVWLTGEQVNDRAALPTAFRQFWQELP